MVARLLAVSVGRADRAVPAIARRQTMRLAGDQLDDLPRAVIQLADQDVDSVEEEVIECDRDDRDRQAERGRDQGQADPVGQRFAPSRPHPAAQRVERLDDPDDGPQQPSKGPSVDIALKTRRLRLSSTTSPAAS